MSHVWTKPSPWVPGLQQSAGRACGLIGFWPFWEGAGATAVDVARRHSAYGEGTLSGATWAGSRHGNALDFASAYVDILDSVAGGHPYVNLSDDITIAAVVRPDAVSGDVGGAAALWTVYYTIIELRTETDSGTHAPFGFGINASKVTLGVTDDHTVTDEQVAGATTLVVGTRYLLAATIRGDDYALYVNGQLDASGTFSVATGDRSVGSTTANMQIGCRSTNAGAKNANYFDGLIDYVALWERALTAGEVADLAARPYDLITPSRLVWPVTAAGIPYQYELSPTPASGTAWRISP